MLVVVDEGDVAEYLNEYPDVTESIDLVSLPTQSISSVTTVTADGDQLPIEVSYTCMYACMQLVIVC